MVAKSRREDCSEVIQSLLESYSMEELAIKCGVTAGTIHGWSKGRRKPPMLAVRLLKSMLNRG